MQIGLDLDSSQLDACFWLAAELIDWNRRANLTAITDPADAQTLHILDSLTVVPLIGQLAPGAFGRLVDVGTGAGFPGLPIKLALPDLEVTLIEATGKKIAFVQHA